MAGFNKLFSRNSFYALFLNIYNPSSLSCLNPLHTGKSVPVCSLQCSRWWVVSSLKTLILYFLNSTPVLLQPPRSSVPNWCSSWWSCISRQENHSETWMLPQDIQWTNQPAAHSLCPLLLDGGVQNTNHKRIQMNTNPNPKIKQWL